MPGEKKQITRNRVSYSCQKCRQRKVKCDKVHPVCGSCQKTDEECVYASNDSDNFTDSTSQPLDTNQAKKRKSSSTDLNQEQLAQNDGTHGSADLEAQLLQLSILLNQLNGIAGEKSCQRVGATGPWLSRTSHGEYLKSRSREAYDGNGGSQHELRHGEEPSSAVNGRHDEGQHQPPNLDTISTQLEYLTTLLRSHKLNVAPEIDIVPNTVPAVFSHDTDIKLFIPNEQQRNALFRCWLSSVFPVLPIADPTTILMHYRTYHFWYTYGLEKGIPNPVEDFMPLIYAVYYAGAISMSLRGVQRWFPDMPRRRIRQAFRKQLLLTLKGPTRALTNPAALSARTMLYYLSSEDAEDVGLTSTSASLVRLAYACNLHREKANESLDKNLAEIRRRLWWEICNLDTFEVCANNMPPSINHHYCDTRMLGEAKDAKVRLLEGDRRESEFPNDHLLEPADDPSTNDRSSGVSAIYIWMKARTILASSARKALSINLAPQPRTKEGMADLVKTLTDLESQIKSTIDRIPTKGIPEQDFTPSGKSGQSVSHDHGSLYGENLISIEVEALSGNVGEAEQWEWPYVQQYRNAMTAFHKWSRIALSLLVDTLYCFSYAPFLSNAKKKLWLSARQCSLHHAHSCLRKYNALASDIELERFRWAWLSLFQPVHACMIILLDSYERPHSQEAPRSRALFDQMLSFSSPEYGIVGGINGMTSRKPLQESGFEAFKMLMQLRAKAWHKAGLDPRLLWTEQDQIDIGAAAPPTEAEKIARSFREDRILSGPSGHSSIRFSAPFVPLMERRVREVTHPSELGVPDDNGSVKNMAIKETLDGTTAPDQGDHQYRHARRDQQRTPFGCGGHQREGASEYRPGYMYPFKLPSEVFDIDQLIEKIKTVQKSSQDGQVEDSSALYQQITTANNDLTNYLARRESDTGAAMNGHDAPSRQPARLTSNMNQKFGPPDSMTSSNVPNDVKRSRTDETISADTSEHQRNSFRSTNTSTTTSSTTQSHQQPPVMNDPHPDNTKPSAADHQSATESFGLNMTDMVNMDFDWAKWDEIFGHLVCDDNETQNDTAAFLDEVRDGW